jgi:predicted DNA-binding protein
VELGGEPPPLWVGPDAVCSMLYMAQRTQIYLRDEQRARLDELAQRRRLTMAEVVRRAIDAYLDADDDFDATFGAAPGLRAKVPSRDEWNRG